MAEPRADDVWRAQFGSLVREIAARNAPGMRPGTLSSTLELSRHAEEELALDNLCHVIEYVGLSLSRAHYALLAGLADRLDMGDTLQEIDLLPFAED
ncbi:hypothetical protein [Streptomyces sp. A5-4]|uniref:hypothetical protein n=1 Tax=Streptomyces sp. A5-4 TaxID=3384771 RepID=UPI003DA99BED